MRLSLQTDYALRTLMFLAARPGRRTIGEIAEFFQISQGHVAKVVTQLVHWGYVRSVRGIGGGLELMKPASEISVGDVVRASEGPMHLLDCVAIDDVCVIQNHCKLRGVLAQAERLQMDFLRNVSLSEVLPFEPAGKKSPGAK